MKKEPSKEAPKKKSGFADFWSKAAKPAPKAQPSTSPKA